MGTIHDLDRRLFVRAEAGKTATPELLSAYVTLAYFAAALTGIRPEALRLGDLVRWIARGDRANVWRR
jgi:hypothetical protein